MALGTIIQSDFRLMPASSFEGVTLHCVDLGARAGVSQHWQPFEQWLTIDAFEPDESALDKGYREKDGVAWFPFGLAARSGEADFYITGVPSGSSLFPPNEPVMKLFTPERYWRVAEVRRLPFLTFSDFLAKYQRPEPELIKLDTQGSELDILRSLDREDWGSVVAVETEVEFAELYKGQPLFRDLDAFLDERGFDLMDLRTHRSYLVGNERNDYYLREYLDLAETRNDMSARLLAGDALYVRRYTDGLPADSVGVRKLALVYCIYHFFDHAFALAERAIAAGTLSESEGRSLISAIKSLAPRPRTFERASSPLRRLRTAARHLVSKSLRLMGRRLPRRGLAPAGWAPRSWPDQ